MLSLDSMGVDYFVIVEAQQFDDYASVIDPSKLLILDPAYQRDYDTFDTLGDTKSKGPGPARNFAWDHSVAAGHAYHWVMDDNIKDFRRFNKNLQITTTSPGFWAAMEDFVTRYENLAMAGPNYFMFVPRKRKLPPVVFNTRIYSCNMIRNEVPFRWRGRYNEDTDLSLQMLKAGWCTAQFNAFLQWKMTTQTVKGGNSVEFYNDEGTLAKSRMQVAMHPDVSRLVWKFGRAHHSVDYSSFRSNKLRRAADFDASGTNNYGMKLKRRKTKARLSKPKQKSADGST
jgi:hypothetical protein